MIQGIPQELLDRLDALAAKFGTTVEYLWPELVRYTWARALAPISCAVLFILAAPFMNHLGVVYLKEREQLEAKRRLTGFSEHEDTWEGAGWFMLVMGWGMVAVAAVMLCVNVPTLLAPAGATLNSLLGIR